MILHRPPSWTNRPFIVWAHRGGHFERPGNTVGAFRHASGLHDRPDATIGLELDVRTTKDRVLVVRHDATLDPIDDDSAKVGCTPSAVVLATDTAEHWIGDDGSGQMGKHYGYSGENPDGEPRRWPYRAQPGSLQTEYCIPRAETVLRQFAASPKTIEIKLSRGAGKALAHLVNLLPAQERELLIVTSMWPHCLASFRWRSRDVATAPSAVGLGWFWLRSIARVPARRSRHAAIQPPYDLAMLHVRWVKGRVVTPRFVRDAHRAGLAVHPWTVNDVGVVAEMLRCEVDGIITDRPAELAGLGGGSVRP